MNPIELKFTNNFYTYLASLMLSNSVANNVTTTGATNTSITYLRDMVTTSDSSPHAQGLSISSEANYLSLSSFKQDNALPSSDFDKYGWSIFQFGSGTNPTDYSLEIPITSGLSFSLSNIHYKDSNNGISEYTILINNTTSDDIQINEMGIIKNLKDSSAYRSSFLLAYGVFSETLIIEGNSSKTLTVQLKMPLTAN